MPDDSRRQLVERVAASRHIAKSVRLRDLLFYLCDRVLNGSAEEIHEQEVGHKVFGRAADYDTGSDNIVRVHASTLRKRLEQYFADEGTDEPVILEIPKGNYAPVFRKRQEGEAAMPEAAGNREATDRRVLVLAVVACILALTTAGLLMRGGGPEAKTERQGPTVRRFWSQVFQGSQPTDIVLDDAGVGLYQELSGKSLALSEYFDRSYLRTVPEGAAAAKLDEATASAIILRRQSSYANVSVLWRLFQVAGAEAQRTNVVFARDYSFRGLKSDNAILLGNPRSNPWIEPFLPRLGLRWMFDKTPGTYYPVDTWAGGEQKAFHATDAGETREGYCGISLLPNLGGNGSVLIISATGGSAFNAAASFLADEGAMANLRKQLPPGKDDVFPHFEALIRVKGRSTVPKDAVVAICRPVRG